jgi:sarcosine oxidase subunit gamma
MADERVTLVRRPSLAQVDLRVDPGLAGRPPYPLPLDPNAAWEEGTRATLWLGPDEWLVLGPPREETLIVAELDTAFAGEHASAVDVSSNRAAFDLGGPGRFELLQTGCSLDLHPRSWRSGMCAQTLFAKADVILHERDDTTRILVRSSFAHYLTERLRTSG